MKAYKVFNEDWTCRGFQYKVGKTYTLEGVLEMCENGFHACKKLTDCFSYYNFDPFNKVAIVELKGVVLGGNEDKQCTDCIEIIRELSWNEVLELVNSGNRNSGNRNSGNKNSGNKNSGFFNSTTPKEILVFNKPCLRSEWENSIIPSFLYFSITEWVSFEDMTECEKTKHPKAEHCKGYLKTLDYKKAIQKSFLQATEKDIELLKALPNFDAGVFFDITGIRI